MSVEERLRWDDIYQRLAQKPYPAPDPFLLQSAPTVPRDQHQRALDLAAGLGQNGIWLATQGYDVDIMDISRIALMRARAEMAMRNLRNINLLQTDLDDVELEREHYDLICVFRYLKRDLFPRLMDAVKVGGRVIYETYNTRYLEQVPAFNPDFLLDVGELKTLFMGWDIRFHDDTTHNEQIVAVKPINLPDLAF